MPRPSTPRCIGIVGSRRRDTEADSLAVRAAFDREYRHGDTIVSGGCSRGGDRFAERIADELGVPIVVHWPQWNTLGRGAGLARNTLIAAWCDVLIACTVPGSLGGGDDTVRKATALGKRVVLVLEQQTGVTT